jgi:dTDP-4-amino-4,6-dideoxygalactose transaminase
MFFARSIPPAACPVSAADLLAGLHGMRNPDASCTAFCRSLQAFFGAEHVFLLSSGAAALTLTLQALRLCHPHKTVVCVPAYCCYSVVSAIESAGCCAAPCDIDCRTLDYDPDSLSRALSRYRQRMLAIIAVHQYGLPADIAHIRDAAGDSVAVIEDAAQAMGATYGGVLAGTAGDIGVFSLGRGKALTAGEGGVILTSDSRYARRLCELSRGLPQTPCASTLAKALAIALFLHPSRFWIPKQAPFLHLGETRYAPAPPPRVMNGFQAGMMRDWREKRIRLRAIRAEVADAWRKQTAGAPDHALFGKRFDRGALVRYPILFSVPAQRTAFLRASHAHGLGCESGYPRTLAALPSSALIDRGAALSGARHCAGRLATLPNHEYVTPPVRREIVRHLHNARAVMT